MSSATTSCATVTAADPADRGRRHRGLLDRLPRPQRRRRQHPHRRRPADRRRPGRGGGCAMTQRRSREAARVRARRAAAQRPDGYDPDMQRPPRRSPASCWSCCASSPASARARRARGGAGTHARASSTSGRRLRPDARTGHRRSLWLSCSASASSCSLVDVAARVPHLPRPQLGPRDGDAVLGDLDQPARSPPWWAQGQEITINGALLSLSLDILVLLALSSRSAAAYARRNERR